MDKDAFLRHACLRKHGFRRRKDAMEVVIGLKKHSDGSDQLNVYLCMYCRKFHVGKNRYKKLKPGQKKSPLESKAIALEAS